MKSRRLPWYKRNPQDWIRKTRELTLEERGAYNDLLELMYLRDRPIADDPRFIAGFLGVSPRKWNILRQALLDADCVVIRGDYVSDERFERDRQQAEVFRDKAVSWGHLGGKKRARTAKRNKQGEFDLAASKRTQNRRNPPVASKATLGETDEKTEVGDNPQPGQQNQGLGSRVALDDLDDSFLSANDGSRDFREDFSEFSSDLSPLKKHENGGNPPPSSKPARSRESASESREEESQLSDSSGTVGEGSGGRKGTKRSKNRAANAQALPRRWEPAELSDDVSAMTALWPAGMVERELERFRDWANGNGAAKKDWDATWRNWLRKKDDEWQREQRRHTGKQGWAAVAGRVARSAH